jgi:hypothetical protein
VWTFGLTFFIWWADYQQLVRKMVMEKFREEEEDEKNSLSPATPSRISGNGFGSDESAAQDGGVAVGA